jgi:hypothetical protein
MFRLAHCFQLIHSSSILHHVAMALGNAWGDFQMLMPCLFILWPMHLPKLDMDALPRQGVTIGCKYTEKPWGALLINHCFPWIQRLILGMVM